MHSNFPLLGSYVEDLNLDQICISLLYFYASSTKFSAHFLICERGAGRSAAGTVIAVSSFSGVFTNSNRATACKVHRHIALNLQKTAPASTCLKNLGLPFSYKSQHTSCSCKVLKCLLYHSSRQSMRFGNPNPKQTYCRGLGELVFEFREN
eukprot:SAG11_NODE_10236_length_845_cov_0.837802_1_plen_150_part_10